MFSVGRVPPNPVAQSHAELTRFWPDEAPRVSILCATYNHSQFIEDAISGFLAQKTPFRFEVVIRDDASTDGTQEIIREFAREYPDVIRMRLLAENKFLNKRPFFELQKLARGEYLAYCEGDDYWVDPSKIFKQYRSLASNPNAVLVHHRVAVLADGVVKYVSRSPLKSTASPQDLQTTIRSRNVTRLFRNVPLPKPPPKKRSGMLGSDRWVGAHLGLYGDAIFDPSLLPAVYREHDQGIWTSLSHADRYKAASKSSAAIAHSFHHRGNAHAARYWSEVSLNELQASLSSEAQESRWRRFWIRKLRKLRNAW